MRYTESYNNIGMVIKIFAMAILYLMLLFAQQAKSQQMVTDDAGVTTHRSYQVETWYGEFESWLIPAIGIAPNLELAAGFAFDSKDDLSLTNYLFEAKYVIGDYEAGEYAFGLVFGYLLDDGFESEEIYTYVPFSIPLNNVDALLHLNAGYAATKGVDWEHAFIYGIRTDVFLFSRFTLLAELFSQNFDTPFFQGGIRTTLIDGLLEMDLTYGRGFKSGFDAPGLTIGLALTPSQIW